MDQRKIEIPRDVRTLKSGNMTISKHDLNIRKNAIKNRTEPGARRSKHPLFAHRYPLQCSMETSRNLVKSVIRTSSVMRPQIGVMSHQLRVSLYMIISQNVM